MEESSSGKCYRCKRTGHLARECYVRKTVDGEVLPLPREKMSVIQEKDEGGEVDTSSSGED